MRLLFVLISSFFVFLSCSLAQAQEEKILHTAVDGTFAPHAMPTLDGGLEGFNIDMINEIAKRIGYKIDIVGMQYSGIVPALEAGTLDFVGAPTTAEKERAENVYLSEGFQDSDFAFIVKKSAPNAQGLEDFRGKIIAVNKGSAYDSYLREHAAEYGWKIESYGTAVDAISAVMAGRADASMAGMTVIAWAAKQNPQLKMVARVPTGFVDSLVFRQGDEKTRVLIENALECLKIDGTMAKLSKKWFDVTPKEGDTLITPFKGYGVPGLAGYIEDDHKPSCDLK